MSDPGGRVEAIRLKRPRRANILLRGIDLVESGDRVLRVGECRIRIRGETRPRNLMEESHPGLWQCGELDLVESDSMEDVFGPSQTCYNRTVTGCTLAPELSAQIRVTDNEGTDGTIFFLSAGSGTAFWTPGLQGDPPVPGPQHLLQVDLTTGDNDYKLVEIAWQGCVGQRSGAATAGAGTPCLPAGDPYQLAHRQRGVPQGGHRCLRHRAVGRRESTRLLDHALPASREVQRARLHQRSPLQRLAAGLQPGV